jgi:hypothetical protein
MGANNNEKSRFTIVADRKISMQTIDCNESNSVYDQISTIHDAMFARAKQLVNPRALIDRQATPENYRSAEFPEIHACNEIIYCIATIGDKVENEITKLIQEHYYLEAMILNAIADQIIFNITSQV